MRPLIPLALCLCLSLSPAEAFEFGTHGVITYKAWLQFQQRNPQALTNLGIVDVADPFSTDRYYDLLQGQARPRTVNDFEAGLLDKLVNNGANGLTRNEPVSVAGWLVRGAIREDDDKSTTDPSPKGDDPDGDMHRVFRHFFDPYLNQPLNGACLLLSDPPSPCDMAPNWAIGTADFTQQPIQPRDDRRNHFTVFDAREVMYRALTGRDGNGADVAVTPGERNSYWATTFRALGDIVHLNQDMAQPQHTRNEPHSGYGSQFTQTTVSGHKSILENFVEASVLGDDHFSVGTDTSEPIRIGAISFTFDGYMVPDFTTYGEFWTRGGTQGLADYSNRGFFTQTRNLGNPSNPYPNPSRNPLDYRPYLAADPVRWDGTPIPPDANGHVAKLYYAIGDVPDALTGVPATGQKMSTVSAWDRFMQRQGIPWFTLTRANYIDQANLLLQRAVGYSTGLLQYFFRGKLTIAMPAEGAYAVVDNNTAGGFKVLKAKVTNATPNQGLTGGKLVAVIKHHRNACYSPDLKGEYGSPNRNVSICRTGGRDDIMGHEWVVVSKPIDYDFQVGEEKTVSFDFTDSPIPLGTSDFFLQVVYRGNIGGEPNAIALGTKNISEPTYFSYFNASDYIHLAGHVYTRSQVDSDPSLLALVYPQSCVNYNVSPPHLVDGCLQPFNIDLDLGFASLAQPTIKAVAMPVKRFLRFAFLTDLDAAQAPALAKSLARPTVRLTAQVRENGATMEKALINQQSQCFPLDPFDVSPLENQLDAAVNSYSFSQLNAVRGIYGWYQTSCVINGDASTPGDPDDRNQAMAALNPDNGETTPFQVQVLQSFTTP